MCHPERQRRVPFAESAILRFLRALRMTEKKYQGELGYQALGFPMPSPIARRNPGHHALEECLIIRQLRQGQRHFPSLLGG